MSLNWKEIDAVLEELPLQDAFVRKVVQPDFRNLVLTCYHRSRTFHLLVCLEPRACRMHRVSTAPPKARQAQRFMQILRSRVQGGRIVGVEHVHHDRIVRLTIRQGGETCLLWLRLWGTAANVILTDQEGVILDAFFRRPARGEVSGARYQPPQPVRPPDDSFTLRELPGEGDFNARIERFYHEQERRQRLDLARERLRRQLLQEQTRLQQRLEALQQRTGRSADGETWQALGDLLTSNLHRIEPGMEWITVEDYNRPGNKVTVQLDPTATPAQNAQRYYQRHKKASTARARIEEESAGARRRLQQTARKLAALDEAEDPAVLESQLERPERGAKARKDTPPGLLFESHGFRIHVGRSARENDILLRHYVRGNDTWLHARDYAGGHVFIKRQPGKSIPLEVLLDAANLALAYSKQRGDGNVYYTEVKYLRRAKHGQTGLVIPTQERNLSLRVDERRLQRLKNGQE